MITNWLKFLRRAADKTKRPITEAQYIEAIDKAVQWPTCACGQLCAALPRATCTGVYDGEYREKDAPLDRVLNEYGIRFSGAISDQRWALALRIFLRIEARTAKLLKSLAKKNRH